MKLAFLCHPVKDLTESLHYYRDTLGFEDYKNGKISDLNQPYKLVNWKIKEGNTRKRIDG